MPAYLANGETMTTLAQWLDERERLVKKAPWTDFDETDARESLPRACEIIRVMYGALLYLEPIRDEARIALARIEAIVEGKGA